MKKDAHIDENTVIHPAVIIVKGPDSWWRPE